MESTTIRIFVATKKKLDKAKQHPRETYDDIINRLMEIKEKYECQ